MVIMLSKDLAHPENNFAISLEKLALRKSENKNRQRNFQMTQ